MSKPNGKLYRTYWYGALLLFALALAGCGGGSSTSSGSGIVGTGKALLSGNVASNSVTGNVSGIKVSVDGLAGETDASGRFTIREVPPGDQRVEFVSNGVASSIQVSVPAGGQVSLNNVRITGSVAKADEIKFSASESDDDDSLDDSDSSDESSADDQSSEDDTSDDDSEDDDDSLDEDDDSKGM